MNEEELRKLLQRIADNIPQDFEKYVEHLLSLSDGEGHGSPAKVKEVSAELFKLAKLEQKPVDTTELEMKRYNEGYVKGVHDAYDNVNQARSILNQLRRERPKQEWSEEDKKMLDNIIKDVMTLHNAKTIEELKCKINWLKSLLPNPNWKPTEAQMKAIKCAINRLPYNEIGYYKKEVLESLYKQLETL